MKKTGLPLCFLLVASPPVLAGLSPPSGVSAAAGDGRVTVTFSAPAVDSSFSPPQDDGQDVISYTLSCSNGKWAVEANTTASPALVTGLKNGTPYTCRARAVYANGYSAWSDPAAAVTPVGKKKSSTDPGGTVPGPGTPLPPGCGGGDSDQPIPIDRTAYVWYPPEKVDTTQSLTVSGACGTALSFTATNATNRGISFIPTGNGPGIWNGKELFVSPNPHDFTTPADPAAGRFCGMVGAAFSTVYIYTTAPTYDIRLSCKLQSGSTYYLNVRPWQGANPYVDPVSTEIGD